MDDPRQDIVRRLRFYIPGRPEDCEEAACEIEQLRAQVEALRVELLEANHARYFSAYNPSKN